MAKVIAPFQIQGTLDDLNFVITADGTNYVRMKGTTGVTAAEFKNNPIFDRIRNHGKEMGYCAQKGKIFGLLAKAFTDRAKEVSSAGRINQLLLALLAEDTLHPKGQRTLEEALKSVDALNYFVGFEANKLRPLTQVLKTDYQYANHQITLEIHPATQIAWPEAEANQLHLALATSVWDYQHNTFETHYSPEIILSKEHEATSVILKAATPTGSGITLTYLFVGFSNCVYKKTKPLHRKYNTATIIQATIQD
ncbi:MAG: hypothetical protein V4670_09515 [Bacteroidota bacterium]